MSLIITEHVKPPVTTTRYDWIAHIDGEEEHGPIGRGATECEALRDLCEQLADMWHGCCDAASLILGDGVSGD